MTPTQKIILTLTYQTIYPQFDDFNTKVDTKLISQLEKSNN